MKNLLRRIYYFDYYRKFRGTKKNVILAFNGFIINPGEITFGDNVFIGRSFFISANSLVFGSNIMIGPGVLIECSNHSFTVPGKTMFSYAKIKSYKGIVIENDVWIGGHVAILAGVTIGEGCVVGACSNVIRSLPPYTICVGNPCKPVRKRFDDETLAKHLISVKSGYSVDQVLKSRNQFFQ